MCLPCNGVVLFDDGGELLPDGRAIAPPPRAPSASPNAATSRPGRPAWAREDEIRSTKVENSPATPIFP
jgi:Family of unknown function (DUF5999)